MTAVEALQDIADAIKAVFPAAEVWMSAEADACFSVALPGVRPLVWVRYHLYGWCDDRYYRTGGYFPASRYAIEESWPEPGRCGIYGSAHSGGEALGIALECIRRLAGNNSQDSG